jgi:hypothetical protein
MSRWLIKTFLLIISFSLVAQGAPAPELNIDSHLKIYEKFNHAVHDNIDDNVQETHSHTHRHEEGGEEHEHDHDHSKISQVELKLIYCASECFWPHVEIDHQDGFYDRSFISSAFPLGIFRPPIA